MTEELTLYQKLKEAGSEIDYHCSDLYVPATEENIKILETHLEKKVGHTVLAETFISAIDGKRWIDLAFQYDPAYAKEVGV